MNGTAMKKTGGKEPKVDLIYKGREVLKRRDQLHSVGSRHIKE